MNDLAQNYITGSAYSEILGLADFTIADDHVHLKLPFSEANANPGNALHGGVAASLSVIAAQALARQVLGEASGPWHTLGFQINYLAAAIGEAIQAEAKLLRRGKDLCFILVEIATAEGKAIAQASISIRARHGQTPVTGPGSLSDDGAFEPGVMKDRLALNPFIGGRGIASEYMLDGQVRMTMPWRDGNASADGGVHEGAVLALLDTAGAMCAWSITGLGKFKASTPSIQAQIMGPPPKGDLLAYGRTSLRDNEMFWNDIEVVDPASGDLVARGTVLYRLIV
jgi:uncharacterized protein (TIGR00369 family)